MVVKVVACKGRVAGEKGDRNLKKNGKGEGNSTMVENGKKHRQNSHIIIPFPTSEGVSEVSERANE